MKRALIFGINDYPGAANDLQGCVNDAYLVPEKINSLFPGAAIDNPLARGMRPPDNVLRRGADDAERVAEMYRNLGFDVKIFLNSQVTIERYEAEISDAFAAAMPGDFIVIWYSGHGTQVPDQDGDEADGYDEALYLYNGAYTDDRQRILIAKKPKNVFLFMGMDCCFSGTNTRDIKKKPRFKPIATSTPLDTAGNVKVKRRGNFIRSFDMDYIVLTGCAEYQTSADAYINGKYQGAMTYYAMKTLEGGISYQEWYKRIRKYLPSSSFDQIPQMEGNTDLLKTGVFGTELKKKGCIFKFFN